MPTKAKPNALQRLLLRAKGIINKPAHWNTHSVRASEDGHFTYCARGAVLKAEGAKNLQIADEGKIGLLAMKTLNAAIPREARHYSSDPIGNVCAYNNSHDHATVMALFDRAIAKAAKYKAARARRTPPRTSR